jgi:Holliday junction DNA helicase RuvA
MIARLVGRVVEEEGLHLVVEAAGVGYEVTVPPYPLKVLRARLLPGGDPRARLAGCAEPVTLHVFAHATERDPLPTLYGFNEAAERRFFALLTTVPRLGPAVAARAFTLSAGEIATRIMTRDVAGLCELPGIGTAKAEEIIARLRGRVALYALLPAEEVPEQAFPQAAAAEQEALVALEELGYRPTEVERLLAAARRAQPEAATVEELLAAVWAQARKG